MFNHDTTGVQESGDFTPIPEGTYTFKLGERDEIVSQKGYHQVKIELIVAEGDYKGKKVTHYITFLPKDNAGAGIAMRWLHAIGEEYEGKFTVDPTQWSGTVTCDVKIEQFTKKDGTIGKSNKIIAVHLPASPQTKAMDVSKQDKSKTDDIDDVPF